MKFCLSSRQSSAYLKKADEIKLPYKDRDIIADLAVQYPEASFVLTIPASAEYEEIKTAYILSKEKMRCSIDLIDTHLIEFLKANNIPFFWSLPVTSGYELQALKKLGVCAAYVAPPLFFNTEAIAKIGVPVRLVPNIPYITYIPGMETVPGSWIRPEDTHLYETIAESIEFYDCDDIKKEQALYRIYAEEKAWSGAINYIISIDSIATNRMIPPQFGINRLTCKQKCQEGGICRVCYHYLTLANEEFLKDVKIKNEDNQ